MIPKGESGKVLRDMEGDGQMLFIHFQDLNFSAIIPNMMLKKASRTAATTLDQVRNEVKAMLREGYQEVDIKEAVSRKYPEHADEALKGLNS